MSAHNVYDNLVYNGNTYNSTTNKWDVVSYGTATEWNGSTTFTSSDKPSISGTTCYQVVKPNTTAPSYSTSTVTASHKYAWNQACTAVTAAGQYMAYDVDYDVDFIAATWLFSYSGTGRQWVAPKAGNYKMECWGAQGGDVQTPSVAGAKGGYVSGTISLSLGATLYAYVGNKPSAANSYNTAAYYYTSNGTNYYQTGVVLFNGGGAATIRSIESTCGGGATDIRTIKHSASDGWGGSASLNSRVMVAGAGGGGQAHSTSDRNATAGGPGGGLIGYNGTASTSLPDPTGRGTYPTGGTQTSGGVRDKHPQWTGHDGGFGFGGQGEYSHYGGGGGSGYYGGGGGGSGQYISAGAGGSSFISGHPGCATITGYTFTSTKMIDGKGLLWTTAGQTTGGSAERMPTTSGGLEPLNTGHAGDGYARITYLPN